MKSGIVQPEVVAVARQRIDDHLSAAKDMHATIEEMLEMVSPVQSLQELCSKSREKCYRDRGVCVCVRGG